MFSVSAVVTTLCQIVPWILNDLWMKQQLGRPKNCPVGTTWHLFPVQSNLPLRTKSCFASIGVLMPTKPGWPLCSWSALESIPAFRCEMKPLKNFKSETSVNQMALRTGFFLLNLQLKLRFIRPFFVLNINCFSLHWKSSWNVGDQPVNSMLEDPGELDNALGLFYHTWVLILPSCRSKWRKGRQPACLCIPRCAQEMFLLSSLLWTELCSPKVHMSKPHPQHYYIWRWALYRGN